MKNNSGISIVATILALLMLSLFIAVAVSLVTTGANIGIQETQGVQAFSIAESGLEKALNYIIKQKDAGCTTSETCACNGISGADFTNVALGAGTFTVTAPAFNQTYVTTPTTLSANITNLVTSIPVASTAGYAVGPGRIMIDREVIEYTSLTVNSFEGCKRGVAGTTAVSHASGTRVGQKQCLITSTGSISTNPLATVQRQVSTVTELQNGWIAGGGGAENLNEVHCINTNNCWAVGDTGTIMQWNGTSWRKVTSPTTQDLNSVFMFSANDGWAVGNEDGNELILRWDGTSWSRLAPSASVANENLNSVFMVSANEVWIVGDDRPGGPNAVAYRWQSGVWSYTDPGTDENLNSVYMLSSNDGWTVGDNGAIRRWTGGPNWSSAALSPAGSNLNSVYCTAPDNCWAVGDTWNPPGPPPVQEVILQWDGTNWTLLGASALVPNENLNGVYCVDADNCWATGDNGTILRWNTPIPNAWNNAASPTTENLNSVFMVSVNDGWAVGDNGTILRWDGAAWTLWGGGRVLRWNGASWTDKTNTLPAGVNQTLRSCSMLSYVDGWAAGNAGTTASRRPLLLQWTGNAWNAYNSTALNINQTLRGVYCVSSNDCWTVGNPGAGATERPLILWWNGTTWARRNSSLNINQTLRGIYCVSANDCWAVGNASGGELIIRWNGANWSRVGPYAGIPDAQLNSVFMIDTDGDGDADDGWAVGNASGGELIIRWNGVTSTWSRIGPYAGIPNVNLNSVFCVSVNDCWAAGNAGNIIRWNGATWNTVASPTTENLNSVFMITSTDGQAVGDAGTIINWNGSQWNVSASPATADLNSVYVIGATTPSGQWEENFPP